MSAEGATVAELWQAIEGGARATAAAKDETIAAKDETISQLAADVAFLREQLDQRSRELAAERRKRFDVIQKLALQRIEGLTATVADQREDAPRPRGPRGDGSIRRG